MVFLLDFFKNLCPGARFFSPGPAKFHKTITFLLKKSRFFVKNLLFFNILLEKYRFHENKTVHRENKNLFYILS